MNKKIMQRWVRALRSGKYKQATGQLKKEGVGHCCLGVLCEVLKQPYAGYDLVLPVRVQQESEMNSLDGTLPKTYKNKIVEMKQSLTEFNDGGLTFKQIALIIERNYKDL